MNDLLNIESVSKILTPEELLKGNFGFEKEGIRVSSKGHLALTPHPEVFGDKLKNPYITTDFSESQIEIVTSTYNNLKDAYQVLSFLVDIVNTNINSDEYIWNQSFPCILPNPDKIPIADYGNEESNARIYREHLSQKYGKVKQMISGIHYNFSFDEEMIKKLYENSEKIISYKEFKNSVYLKVARNYLRYKWLIILITGSTPAAHNTFTKECTSMMDKKDGIGSYYSENGVSFRNSRAGYKNLEKLFPRYTSVKEFTADIQEYINKGILSEAKELYTQIRLKSADPSDYLKSLNDDGIKYVEIRSIDINPFDKCGISLNDAKFVHLFIVYLLLKEESDYEKWQEEGLINEEIIAESAFNENVFLYKNGIKITINNWANEILNELSDMNKSLNLKKEEIIRNIRQRINNPEKSYSKQLTKIIKNKGFINSQLSIAKHNKETSLELIDIDTITNNKELYEIYTKSLPLKKV